MSDGTCKNVLNLIIENLDKFGSRRLMEVSLPVMDLEKDKLAQTEPFKKGYKQRKLGFSKWLFKFVLLVCSSPELYCIHSDEPGNKKDGAGGDSGTGIVSRRGPLAGKSILLIIKMSSTIFQWFMARQSPGWVSGSLMLRREVIWGLNVDY